MLCWEAVQVSEPIPCSRPVKTRLSSAPGSKQQPRAGLLAGSKPCWSLVESRLCDAVVTSSAMVTPVSLCAGEALPAWQTCSYQESEGLPQGSCICTEGNEFAFPQSVPCLLLHTALPCLTQLLGHLSMPSLELAEAKIGCSVKRSKSLCTPLLWVWLCYFRIFDLSIYTNVSVKLYQASPFLY